MTNPSSSDIKAMGDIIAAMNRVASEAPAEDYIPTAMSESQTPSGFGEVLPSAPIPTGDMLMGDILKRFNSVAETLTETAETNMPLKEALKTTQTKTGVIIGEWQIEKTERTYNVVNTTTDYPIAHGLGLYEAALALTKALNAGKSITSADVKEILQLEEDFTRNLHEAATFKKRYQTADSKKQSIFEARYTDARQKAITAKTYLAKLAK